MVDACESMRPTSAITPDATVKSVVHDGSVAIVTRIAPGFNERKVAGIAQDDHLGLDRPGVGRIARDSNAVRDREAGLPKVRAIERLAADSAQIGRSNVVEADEHDR